MLAKLLICSLSLGLFLNANDSFDALDGFEEESITSSPAQTQELQTEEEKPYTLSGELSFKSSYGYRGHRVDGVEYEGVNQAQSALFLQLDYALNESWKLRASGDGFYDAYYELSKKNFNQDVLDTYETQLRFDDLYLQGKLTQDLDLKIGRQRVVWGKSDSIRITDVINPLDNRLPGVTDIEDLRLSTAMAKLDYYFGNWNLSAMMIAESRIFIEPAPRGEFFPVDAIFPNAPRPFIELETPTDGIQDFDTMQYALAANGVFSGWDLSFYGADVLDSRWHVEGALANAIRRVSKIKMLGSALNIASGSWLLKSEVAFLDDLRYNSTQEEKSRFDALIGFDYMGISDTVLSLEVANRHLFNHERQMSQKIFGLVPDYVQEDEVQTAIRATHSLDNDRINLNLLVNMFGHHWQYGGFVRAWLEYDIADAVQMSVGVIDYMDTQNIAQRPMSDAISDNDKIFADLSYSF